MHGFDGLGVLHALLLHFDLLFRLWNLDLGLGRVQTGPIEHEGRHLLVLANQRILVLHDDWSGGYLWHNASLWLLLIGRQNAVLVFPLLACRDGTDDLGLV